jgi:hypothetical protein
MVSLRDKESFSFQNNYKQSSAIKKELLMHVRTWTTLYRIRLSEKKAVPTIYFVHTKVLKMTKLEM